MVVPLVGNVRHLIKRTWYGSRSNYIFGLFHFSEMGLLLHYIKKDELFIEVGANTGVYSLLASGVNGAQSIAIEPSPQVFDILNDNVRLNNIQNKTRTIKAAIGAKNTHVYINQGSSILDAYVSEKKETGESSPVKANMFSLDEICKNESPAFLLIDVICYAHEVLKGAKKVLSKPSLKIVLIRDVNLNIKNGFNPNVINEVMIGAGFSLYQYDPFSRKFQAEKFSAQGGYIYIRDMKHVLQRVSNAPVFTVSGKTF